MIDIDYIDNLPPVLDLKVPAGETLNLRICAFSSLQNTIINVDVDENGYFNGVLADFTDNSFKFIVNVSLKSRGSSCEWHAASLAKNKTKKVFEPSVTHNDTHQYALMSNYGIARDESELVFAGCSEIIKGAKATNTRQEAKIIVFDEKCKAKASPILKIGENDISASHGAVVGRLNDQHLFYLESRGISEEQAKRLITLGYLKPITNCFTDEKLKERIIESIEKGI